VIPYVLSGFCERRKIIWVRLSIHSGFIGFYDFPVSDFAEFTGKVALEIDNFLLFLLNAALEKAK
jgi:hypothetical protein